MSPDIVLEFSNGFVRPLKIADVHPGYILGLNDPDVNRYLEVRHTLQNWNTVTDFVQINESRDDALLFGVWQTGADKHCGTVRLHGINYIQGTVHIGVCLFDKSAWGKKLGLSAVSIVTQWVFKTLNIKKIEAGVYLENDASRKTFLEAGYKWINDIPDKFYLDGKPTVVKIFVAQKALN